MSFKYDNRSTAEVPLYEIEPLTIITLLLELENCSFPSLAVEAGVGLGKTVLCQKIIWEWLNKQCSHISNDCVLHLQINDELSSECDENLSPLDKLLSYLPDHIDQSSWATLQEHESDLIILVDIENISSSHLFLHKLVNMLLPKSKYIFFCRSNISESLSSLVAARIALNRLHVDQVECLVHSCSPTHSVGSRVVKCLRENPNILQLCTNPFICTMLVSTCKENTWEKLFDDKLEIARRVVDALWKRQRYRTQGSKAGDYLSKDLDILLLSTSSLAIKAFSEGEFMTESDIRTLDHAKLFFDSGIFDVKRTDSSLHSDIIYTFLDPYILEYACALGISELIRSQTSDSCDSLEFLQDSKWRNICCLTAGILGEDADLLLEQVAREEIDSDNLSLLCDCLHASRHKEKILRDLEFTLPPMLDFTSVPISSSTMKGQ